MNEYVVQFNEIFKNNITREGADKLLDYLNKSDFFTAPASTRFHSAFECGLVEHSVKVYKRLKNLIDNQTDVKVSDETIAIVALLHDLCKVNFYKVEMRNAKDDNGNWVKVPFYTIDDQLCYGHGEGSVYIVSGFMKITREEAISINWHMGGFDDRVKGGSFSLGKAWEKYPLGMYLHFADMLATNIDEV